MLWFEFRAGCFRCRRFVINLFDRTHRRHHTGARLRDAAVIAEPIAPLWPSKEISERALVLGKIENLRVARLAFDGIELSRGEVLSFWAQLGRPSRSRGFVIGRELREGCLIPSIGGGLCQLSNALYDAAFKAGFEVVERSAHSQIIPGSAAARDRDATVFWNYVDRRHHVLMHALPMTRIHMQLETAATRYPDEPTLRDFRADQALLRDEREALDGAERWIGPHAGMLRLAGEKAQALPWQLPAADIANRERRPGLMRVYFPASSLVRKGALASSGAAQDRTCRRRASVLRCRGTARMGRT